MRKNVSYVLCLAYFCRRENKRKEKKRKEKKYEGEKRKDNVAKWLLGKRGFIIHRVDVSDNIDKENR